MLGLFAGFLTGSNPLGFNDREYGIVYFGKFYNSYNFRALEIGPLTLTQHGPLTRLDEHFFVTVVLLIILEPQSLYGHFVFVYRSFSAKENNKFK